MLSCPGAHSRCPSRAGRDVLSRQRYGLERPALAWHRQRWDSGHPPRLPAKGMLWRLALRAGIGVLALIVAAFGRPLRRTQRRVSGWWTRERCWISTLRVRPPLQRPIYSITFGCNSADRAQRGTCVFGTQKCDLVFQRSGDAIGMFNRVAGWRRGGRHQACSPATPVAAHSQSRAGARSSAQST